LKGSETKGVVVKERRVKKGSQAVRLRNTVLFGRRKEGRRRTATVFKADRRQIREVLLDSNFEIRKTTEDYFV